MLKPGPALASLEIDSQYVKWLRPRLGRRLASAAAVLLLGPLVISMLAFLAAAIGLDLFVFWKNGLNEIFGWSYRLAPALAALSALASSLSFPRPSRAGLSIGPDGLTIRQRGRARLVPRERIAEGIVIPSRSKAALELHLRNGDTVRALTESELEAEAALDALGVDPARRKVAVTLGTSNRQLAAGCAAFIASSIAMIIALMVLAGGGLPVLLILSMCISTVVIASATLFRAFRPTEVAIGTDGVAIRRPFSSRFIPYSLLESVSSSASRLLLQWSSQRLSGQSFEEEAIAFDDADVLRALAQRIREAMKLGAGRDAESLAGVDLLDPAGRTLAEWRDALRALVHTEAGYRKQGLTTEDLFTVLGSPDAPAAHRIGAAMALQSSRHPEARERILVAAEACASDTVRAALESAAEDELTEAALEQAIRR